MSTATDPDSQLSLSNPGGHGCRLEELLSEAERLLGLAQQELDLAATTTESGQFEDAAGHRSRAWNLFEQAVSLIPEEKGDESLREQAHGVMTRHTQLAIEAGAKQALELDTIQQNGSTTS